MPSSTYTCLDQCYCTVICVSKCSLFLLGYVYLYVHITWTHRHTTFGHNNLYMFSAKVIAIGMFM